MGLVSFGVGATGFIVAILLGLVVFGHISKNGRPSLWDGVGVIFSVFAIIAGLSVAHSFGQIDAGYVGLQKSMGGYTGHAFTQGMYTTTPILTSVEVVDLHNKHQDLPQQVILTKDQQSVPVDAAINYNLNASTKPLIVTMTNIGQEGLYEKVIQSQFIAATKATIARYNFADANSHLDAVSNEIRNDTERRIRQIQGTDAIQIQQISLKNIQPSEELKKAIEQKVIAAQNAQTEKQNLQKVQYQTQQQVTQAKGQSEAQKYQARTISNQYLELKRLEVMKDATDKWDGHISPFASNPFGNGSVGNTGNGGAMILDARSLMAGMSTSNK